MQQNNEAIKKINQYTGEQKCIYQMIKFLQQKQKFIQTDLTSLLTHPVLGLGHIKYPVKVLKYRKQKYPNQQQCGTLYDIRNKLQTRLSKFNLKKLTSITKQQRFTNCTNQQNRITTHKSQQTHISQQFHNSKQFHNSYQIVNNKQFEQNRLLIVSDLLIWSIPNILSSYMGMMNYIKKWKSQQLVIQTKQQIIQKNQVIKKLINTKQSSKLNYFTQIINKQSSQSLEYQVLKLPLIIISEYFQKWLEIITYYQSKELKFKQKFIKVIQFSNNNSQNKQQNSQNKQQNSQNKQQVSNNNIQSNLLKNLLNQAKLQKIQIQNKVKQAQKYIQDIQTVQNHDPQVYKNRLILNQFKPLPNPKNKYLIKFGIRLHFIVILKQRVQKAQKHLKQRKNNIFQLIDMQRNYIEILAGYIQGIKRPIQNLKVLTQDQIRLLFCNIQQIKKFHQQLYQILSKRYQTDHKYQTYGDIIKGVIPFFKLYVDYINQAKDANNFLIKLVKDNQQIRQICDKYFIQKHKPASDQLLQPTYKIARYQMLFEEIIKKSNPKTADFKLFTQAKQQFNHKLIQVNDTVDKIVRRKRLNQLQQQFGTPDQPIFIQPVQSDSPNKKNQKKAQACQYLNQFNVFLVYQQKFLNVILYAFTHVILIVEQHTKKKLKYIPVDQKFYARRQQDSKVYKNVIKIHSKDGYVTVSTGNDDKNLKKAEELYQVLKKIQKTTQSKQLIYIQVLGTQQIGSTSFAKYTEYIIEIKFMALKKLLHLRFSQIANIVKIMQHQYKDSLGITQQQTLKKTWFNNHKSKTIQDRKRTIQQILQKLFNHQLIKKDPKKLLDYLNLPQNFFQIAKNHTHQKLKWSTQSSGLKKRQTRDIIHTSKLNKQQSIGSSKLVPSKTISTSKLSEKQSFIAALKITDSTAQFLLKNQSQLSKKQMKQAFTLLYATQIKLGRDIYHDVDQKVQLQRGQAQKIQIYIHTMPNDQVKMVRVTKYDTVEDVCNKVSKLLGLRQNRDFRLFHQIGKKQLRVLQHEQLILKIFSFPKPKRPSSTNNVTSLVNNVSNAFSSVASSLVKVLSPQTHPTLIFKKYYFLPYEIESRQFKKDLTRLRLLTYQVFSQMKDMKYQLNFDQYIDMTALLIYIELDGDKNIQQIDPSIIHRVIPQTIFKLKNYSQQQWLKKIQPKLIQYQQKLQKVIQYNESQMKQNKLKHQSPQKTALYFGHRHLASLLVLSKIKLNPIFGSNLFYVQPYKKTYEQLTKESLKMAYNMWLAIKVDSLSLLTPSSKQSQFELKYSDIQKINVYSQAIVFKTDDYLNKQYRLNTYQSFEISQLVRYYKTLNEIMIELKQDEKLSNQVKKYRNDIEKYKSTYQNHSQNYTDLDINFG